MKKMEVLVHMLVKDMPNGSPQYSKDTPHGPFQCFSKDTPNDNIFQKTHLMVHHNVFQKLDATTFIFFYTFNLGLINRFLNNIIKITTRKIFFSILFIYEPLFYLLLLRRI